MEATKRKKAQRKIELPAPAPELVSRPRMGKEKEDLPLRVMDWFAREKKSTNKETH